MVSPVVVGVDGSDAGFTALDWAVDEAKRHGCPLRIVHASLWERYEGVTPALTTHRPSGQVFAENVVGTAAERAGRRAPGLALKTDVVPEDAAGALLRAGHGALMLVVGSRGRGELAGLLLGSVGLLVAARSHGPAVVVRGDRQALDAHHGRVVLGVGDHDVDSPAVRFAFREAAARNADLEAVRLWRRPGFAPAGHPLLPHESDADFEHSTGQFLDKALETAAREHPQVAVRARTAEGPAHRRLTELSAAADLLVVGAQRREGIIGLELGRVAHRALHHAACPVAVIPRHSPAVP